MTVRKRVRIANRVCLPLSDKTFFRVSVSIIPISTLGQAIGKLGWRRKAILRSAVTLVGVITAVIPEAVDFHGINKATGGAGPVPTSTYIRSVVARPGRAAGGISRIKPAIVGVEEGVGVAWADC